MSSRAQLFTAIVILVLCAAGVGLIGVMYVGIGGNGAPPNADLCPSDRPVKGHVVVAVDWTDAFSDQQREALRDIVRRLKQELRVEERLSLVVIRDSPEDSATPIFSVCKPLDPDNINPLIQNERKLKAKWDEQFGRPLDEKLAQLLKGSTAAHSPILEAIDVIMWSHNFQADLPRRRLIIFSDLLQNWQGHSHYKKVPTACEFMRTPSAQRLKARSWEDVSVVLHYWRNPRDSQYQTQDHLNFWIGIFYQFGAVEVRVGRKLADPGGSCVETQSLPGSKREPNKAKVRKRDDGGWFPLVVPSPPPKKG